jgi:hypothetical protein
MTCLATIAWGLGDGPNGAGKPLVHNYSCRRGTGDFTFAFSHLSCIIKYAEQRSKQYADGKVEAFINPWYVCNHCRQPFRNILS